MVRKKQAFALLGASVIGFLAENKRSNTELGRERYAISSRKIPKAFDGKKIIFLSDLHNAQIGKENERLIQEIDREAPDYIFIGGDMIVSKAVDNCEEAVKLIRYLAAKYPVYLANGNHEERLLWKEAECPKAGEIYREYIKEVTECGAVHLYNKTIKIEEAGSFIYLSGLEINSDYYEKLQRKRLPLSYIRHRLGDCKEDSFHILLAHNPCYFKTYASWGADLTLSGHLHGGIIRLPMIGGVIAPSYRLFPKYDAGLFRIGGRRMIVSVGLGSHSIKIRLFNPPKIDIITLAREERVLQP
ncbi:MAG: metallophosphoesterase [Lachnospiraceae bacterium]|nr:metallophosphoesterase [Lachnospiraceae bacterium]